MNNALWSGIVVMFAISLAPSLQAQSYQVFYSFPTEQSGADQTSTLIIDSAGNLYGTSYSGGTSYGLNCSYWGGCGTVFRITPQGKKTTLYNFGLYAEDGQNPFDGVVTDGQHNLYGTTIYGGSYGFGTAFKLDATGKETVLHSFTGGADGKYADGGLVLDSAGNLFGAAQQGGDLADCSGSGCGTIYKIAPDGTFTVIHTFTEPDGSGPTSSLILDKQGNLYGTAEGGGTGACIGGCGTLFKLEPGGTFTVVHSFAGSPGDGLDPQGWPVMDSAGNIYGTTVFGGKQGYGTIYKINTNNQETVLFNFSASPPNPGGQYPSAGLLVDARGNLYGTASIGGTYAAGTIFRLSVDGKLTVLHNFRGRPNDGEEPDGGLVSDGHGNVFGGTGVGGSGNCPPPPFVIGCGIIYKLSK